ncbi:hypothetical protein C9374_010512 [Naegleria lovaniensis]|uniref:Uncharacterized protein n=1 Tax=Naegleria lovaniensis TaxID=51637 RepID=A0AA88GGI7_NAELO|nr:uncharacterized protein C9374_010512 [Naegleria lovaniensis]KAG2374768.1 hypothetical protein C9374_010512 [Naegleria lovaniensis]
MMLATTSPPSRIDLTLAFLALFILLFSNGFLWAQEMRMALNPSTLQSWELASSMQFCKRNLTVDTSLASSSPGSGTSAVLSRISVMSALLCNSSSSGNVSQSSTSSLPQTKRSTLSELQQPIQGEAPLESIGFFTNLELTGFTTGLLGLDMNEQGSTNTILQLLSLVQISIFDKSKQSSSSSTTGQSQSQTASSSTASSLPPLLFPFSPGVLKTIYFTNSSLQNIQTTYGMKVVNTGASTASTGGDGSGEASKVMYFSVHADSEIGHLMVSVFVAEQPTILKTQLIPANSTINPNKNNVLLLPESVLLVLSIDQFNAQRLLQMDEPTGQGSKQAPQQQQQQQTQEQSQQQEQPQPQESPQPQDSPQPQESPQPQPPQQGATSPRPPEQQPPQQPSQSPQPQASPQQPQQQPPPPPPPQPQQTSGIPPQQRPPQEPQGPPQQVPQGPPPQQGATSPRPPEQQQPPPQGPPQQEPQGPPQQVPQGPPPQEPPQQQQPPQQPPRPYGGYPPPNTNSEHSQDNPPSFRIFLTNQMIIDVCYLAIPTAASYGKYNSEGKGELVKFLRTTQSMASLSLGSGGASVTTSQSQMSETQSQQQSQTISNPSSQQGGRLDLTRMDIHIPLATLTPEELSQDAFILWGPVYFGHVEQQGSTCSCSVPQQQQQPQSTSSGAP